MPSWFSRVLCTQLWSRQSLFSLGRPRLHVGSDSSESIFYEDDNSEEYDQPLLSELEYIFKRIGKNDQQYDAIDTYPSTVYAPDEREENFQKIWTRAKLQVDRQLLKPRHKTRKRHYDPFPCGLPCCFIR